MEYNQAVRAYISSERQKNGVDPTTKPDFNPRVDPSCALISTEMNRIMGFFNFLKAHNKSTDVIFVDLIDKMNDQFHYFDGSKQLENGLTMQQAMQNFELIFAPVIDSYRSAWLKSFNEVFAELKTYEEELSKKNAAESEAK